ncbi:MAG: DUF1905 domain-containing protein [Ilumatobacteraceae bacterium]
MSSPRFTFTAQVWLHDGGSWHFVSVPEDDADVIEEMFGVDAGGFGSVRVEVTIGATEWRTSLFPDSKRKTYVLPIKKSVRLSEGLCAGQSAYVAFVVVT